MMPLDSNVPPHRTKVFWYIVVLALVLFVITYSTAAQSHEPLWSKLLPTVAASAMLIWVGWFAVRRIQRDLARGIKPSVKPTRFRLVMLLLAAVFLLLSFFMRKHSAQPKHFLPADEKPDYIKKLEKWKP